MVEPRRHRATGQLRTTVQSKDEADCSGAGCDISDLFRLLGQAHMLDILYTCIQADGAVRFSVLQDRLSLSPNTLSSRLKALVAAGLLTRTAYQEIPPRVDYEATAKARDLSVVFRSLGEWANRHSLQAILAT